jgi:hypothetical protein
MIFSEGILKIEKLMYMDGNDVLDGQNIKKAKRKCTGFD